MSLIVYAIPVFFLLIGVELLISKMQNLSYYRFPDSIANLSCGIGSQIAGIFTKTVTFIGYLWLYEHRVWDIQNTWITGILLFIGVDFFYYWFHRLAHEVSFLWGSHVVHHQSEEYNLTVALRQAALQGAFSWVFYLPLAIAGFPPTMFLTIASLQTLYQFWIHTKLIGKMHPLFEYTFNTPSHHRVHHGVNPKYIDRNHGGTLIIFDRMFGTFQVEDEVVVYGVTKQTKSWNPLWVNFEYWIGLFKDVFQVQRIKDAGLMLIKAPGWKPKDLGGADPVREGITPETFDKYDTEISVGLSRYVWVHFILVLLGTTAFLFMQKTGPFAESFALKVAFAAMMVLSLVNIGGIFEKKSWVPVLEFLRLAMAVALIAVLFKSGPWFLTATIIIAVLAGLSMLWFSTFVGQFKIKQQEYVQAGTA